ncbi:putative transmembrane protein [Tieghemostelium lacteum]|uniref:Putative transmembrane protein n=1 Tax=Tieghemostelium lacteum TaxID=361077 RepID=A0A152A2N2_TIELA|nr:putative transmembrane protein [Tieghemostelium lacteum]|eukprot:KYR00486.1 putative transmembrane protein [Tieghemostelium lacteum]
MLKYLLVLILILHYVNSMEQGEFVKVISKDDDSIRSLTYSDLIPGTFYVSGKTLLFDNHSTSIDTSAFYFSSGLASLFGLPLSYYYAYSETNVEPGNISSNGVVSAFAPAVIVEYEETNGEEGYQLDQDTVLGWIRLDLYGGFDIESTSQDVSGTKNGKDFTTKVYNITATSPNGLFGMRFIVPGASIEVDGTELNANQSKSDIFINGYYDSSINDKSLLCSVNSPQFSCQSTGPSGNANSRLALATFFLTKEYNVNAATFNPRALKIKGKLDIEIGLSWVDKANIKGVEVKVHSSVQAFNNGKKFLNTKFNSKFSGQLIIFSFDGVRPDNIVYDPVQGEIVDSEPSSASKSIISSLLILFAVLFSLF